MPDNNKSSLNNMLQAVLSTALTEQNATYPPYIYTTHYNIAASYLISTIAEQAPNSPTYIDVIQPFLKKVRIVVKGGVIILPEDYRNIFGTPSVSVKQNLSGECGESDAQNEHAFQEGVRKGKCLSRPINIVSQSEWDDLTTSTYNFPTYEFPIGCFFGGNELKICPYDITSVELRYIKQEKTYLFGYLMQPDDTYVYDASTSIETEFTSAAFKYLYKAINALYAAYTKDPSARDWSLILTQAGIL